MVIPIPACRASQGPPTTTGATTTTFGGVVQFVQIVAVAVMLFYVVHWEIICNFNPLFPKIIFG